MLHYAISLFKDILACNLSFDLSLVSVYGHEARLIFIKYAVFFRRSNTTQLTSPKYHV